MRVAQSIELTMNVNTKCVLLLTITLSLLVKTKREKAARPRSGVTSGASKYGQHALWSALVFSCANTLSQTTFC